MPQTSTQWRIALSMSRTTNPICRSGPNSRPIVISSSGWLRVKPHGFLLPRPYITPHSRGSRPPATNPRQKKKEKKPKKKPKKKKPPANRKKPAAPGAGGGDNRRYDAACRPRGEARGRHPK